MTDKRDERVTSHGQSGGITGRNVNVTGAPPTAERRVVGVAAWATILGTIVAIVGLYLTWKHYGG